MLSWLIINAELMEKNVTKKNQMDVKNLDSRDESQNSDAGGHSGQPFESQCSRSRTSQSSKAINSSSAGCPKFSLLTSMLTSGSQCGEMAAVHDSSVATPQRHSEEALAEYPIGESSIHGMFTSVAEPSTISKPNSNLLGLLSHKQVQTVSKPLNFIVDYVGIVPTNTECPSDEEIFQQWEANQSLCEVCNERCPTRSVYKEHYLLHRSLHVEGHYFRCYQCKKLQTKYYIREHVKIHSKIRPYSCETCGKSYICKASYKVHLAIHYHVKQVHACSECGEIFDLASSLCRHALVHQRKASKRKILEKLSDEDVYSSDEMEKQKRSGKQSKSIKSQGHGERPLPNPDISEDESSVKDVVIKEEPKTEDSDGVDMIAATSFEKQNIGNTLDNISVCLEKRGTKDDVPVAGVTMKQEPGSVVFDAAEMSVTLPHQSVSGGIPSEDNSQSVTGLFYDHHSNDAREAEGGSIVKQGASEVERITVSSDAGVEEWIVKKAGSDEEDGQEDATLVTSESSQDLVSSRYGIIFPNHKSSTSLLSAMMTSEVNKQERTRLDDVKAAVNHEAHQRNRAIVRKLLDKKTNCPSRVHAGMSNSHYPQPEKARKSSPNKSGGQWSSKVELSKHMNSQFNEQWISNNFKCPKCGEYCQTVFIYREHCLYHRSMSNSDGEFVQCSECFTTVQNIYLWRHVKIHSGPFACSICGETYTFKSKYNAHIMMHRKEGHTYTCRICKKDFQYHYLLKRHQVVHRKHQSGICGNASSVKQTFDSPRPEYICDVCGKVYLKRAALLSHMRTTHAYQAVVGPLMQVTYKCNRCDAEFPKVGILRRHMVTCRDTSCGAKLTNTSESSSPSNLCKECGETFLGALALEKHFKNVHGEAHKNNETTADHECRICGKTYSDGKDLLAHKNLVHGLSCGDTSIGDKQDQYSCLHCNELFQMEEHLQEHYSQKCKLNTTGKKHVKCDDDDDTCSDDDREANKRTVHRKSVEMQNVSNSSKILYDDSQILSGFQCDVCLKVFKTEDKLQKHTQSAHEQIDVKPVPCDQCHEIFTDEAILSIHKRMSHDSENLSQKAKEDVE